MLFRSPAVRRDSIESLSIHTAMNKYSSPNLLAVSFSSIPSLDSTHSFGQVPEYPRATRSAPLFLTLSTTPTLLCPELQSLAKPSNVAISVPTVPRMRLLLTEPISVTRWMVKSKHLYTVADSDDRMQEQSPLSTSNTPDGPRGDVVLERSTSASWRPEGSLFPPEDFEASLRKRRTQIGRAHV